MKKRQDKRQVHSEKCEVLRRRAGSVERRATTHPLYARRIAHFAIRITICFMTSLACFFAPGEGQSAYTDPYRREEARGLWVVRDALCSPTSILQMVKRARNNNFNMILVQVRSRGDAYYKSQIVPEGEPLRRRSLGFDPLETAINEGHKMGLEVHAWINIYIIWSSPWPPKSERHILHLHPDWLASSIPTAYSCKWGAFEDDEVDGIYLSPGLPQVQEHLLKVVAEIINNYDIDGLHLDYVRYPGRYFDYNAFARTAFMQKYGVDPLGVALGSERLIGFFGTVGMADLSEKWLRWRAEQVTSLVTAIRNLISEKNPQIKLSVAAKPDIGKAYQKYGQDWVSWTNEGIIDFVVPMAYSEETELMVEQIRQAQEAVRKGHLYAGIGTYNQPLSETLKQITKVRALGIRGFCLFSYNILEKDEGSFERLREILLDKPAKIPSPVK